MLVYIVLWVFCGVVILWQGRIGIYAFSKKMLFLSNRCLATITFISVQQNCPQMNNVVSLRRKMFAEPAHLCVHLKHMLQGKAANISQFQKLLKF